LERKTSGQVAPERLSKLGNATSQRKFDAIDRIFQAFVDVIFLEFIEDERQQHAVG
jgi:hypothetical protein